MEIHHCTTGKHYMISLTGRQFSLTARTPPESLLGLVATNTCIESALMSSPLNAFAIWMANFDFPVPVEPKTTTTGRDRVIDCLIAAIMSAVGACKMVTTSRAPLKNGNLPKASEVECVFAHFNTFYDSLEMTHFELVFLWKHHHTTFLVDCRLGVLWSSKIAIDATMFWRPMICLHWKQNVVKCKAINQHYGWA